MTEFTSDEGQPSTAPTPARRARRISASALEWRRPGAVAAVAIGAVAAVAIAAGTLAVLLALWGAL